MATMEKFWFFTRRTERIKNLS